MGQGVCKLFYKEQILVRGVGSRRAELRTMNEIQCVDCRSRIRTVCTEIIASLV